jgi:hypothetical protein
MTDIEFDVEVATATGDSIDTIRRSGFSMLVFEPSEMHPDDLRPPQIIDWDSATPELIADFIDELFD